MTTYTRDDVGIAAGGGKGGCTTDQRSRKMDATLLLPYSAPHILSDAFSLSLSLSLNTVPLPLPKRVDTGPRSDGPQADRDWKHALDNLSAQSHRHTEMMKWGANLWGPSRDKGPSMRVPLGRSTWVIVHPSPIAMYKQNG